MSLQKSPRSLSHVRVAALILVLADLCAITLSTILAIEARQTLPWFRNEGSDVQRLVAPLALVIIPGWLLSIHLIGGYLPKNTGSGLLEYVRIINASVAIAGLLGMTAYLFMYPLSRGFFVLLFAFGIPLLVADRYAMRRLVRLARKRGHFITPTLVAGDRLHVNDLLKVLNRHSWLGFRVVGVLLHSDEVDDELSGLPVLGRPEKAVAAIAATGAQAVIFAEGSFNRAHDFSRLAGELEDVAAQTIVVPALSDISAARLTIRPVGGIPLVQVGRSQAERASRLGKRSFDVIGAFLLIVLSLPVMLAVAVAIKLDDGGPIVFRQPRVGRRGTLFSCLKFRSMAVDAERRRAEISALNEADGALFKVARDPRITRVGRVIRRFSIDEVPQLFNILKGEMSLVGPRPALAAEVAAYEAHVTRRLDVRPGLTGLWQVSGRSDLTWEETVRLDLYYVNNWSMLQDVSILFRTAEAVLTARGAY